MTELLAFLQKIQRPFAVVSTLLERDQEAVVKFLLKLRAPVYLEGVSGIREVTSLQDLRITHIDSLWKASQNAGYCIDGILRIGGVPTFRPWRDLENKQHSISHFSLSHLPFLGLSYGTLCYQHISHYLSNLPKITEFDEKDSHLWRKRDKAFQLALKELIDEVPHAEPSLFRHLSTTIPKNSLVFLGNSLPIREWDLAATYQKRNFRVFAARGVNGIDGQVSTFLGMALANRSNWGIFGDLTMLYDVMGPWILDQLKDLSINLVVINNGGGKIFSKMFPQTEFQNSHCLSLEPIATLFGLDYYSSLPKTWGSRKHCLIELLPDSKATEQFWEKFKYL